MSTRKIGFRQGRDVFAYVDSEGIATLSSTRERASDFLAEMAEHEARRQQEATELFLTELGKIHR